MQVTVDIPDEMAKLLPPGEAMSRELLEAYAADAYRLEHLTRAQVGRLLGLNRWQAEEFLLKRGVKRPFTVAFETYARPPFCTSAMTRSFS